MLHPPKGSGEKARQTRQCPAPPQAKAAAGCRAVAASVGDALRRCISLALAYQRHSRAQAAPALQPAPLCGCRRRLWRTFQLKRPRAFFSARQFGRGQGRLFVGNCQ